MKRKNKFIITVLLTVGLAGITHASLLSDGNFSLATSGSLTSNSDWSLTANSPDGNDLGAQFQTGFANAQNTGAGGTEAPGTGTGIWFRSFEGNQGGSGEVPALGTIIQSVTAPADGDYTLNFVAGREVNFTAAVFDVSLSAGAQSTSVNLLTAAIPDGNLGGAASGNAGGTPFSLTLSGVTAGETILVEGRMRVGVDSQIPGGQSAFLDGFSLVPEPGSLSLLGLGVMSILGLRRRR